MTPSVRPFTSQLPVKIAFGDGDDRAPSRCARRARVRRARSSSSRSPSRSTRGVTAALAAAESGGRPSRAAWPRGLASRPSRSRTSSRLACAAVVSRRSSASAAARRSTSRRPPGSPPTRAAPTGEYASGARRSQAAAHRSRPLPDDVGYRQRGLGRERPHGHGARPEDRLRPSGHARAARARRSGADVRAARGADRALGRRRHGAGDRRLHRDELVPAVGRLRAGGVPPRRALAPRGGRRRSRRGGATPPLLCEPHGRPGDEPLRLRRRPRARAGARERQAPSPRSDDRARPRGDARVDPRRLRRPAGARRGRARGAAGRDGATALVPCAPCSVSSPTWGSRRCPTST